VSNTTHYPLEIEDATIPIKTIKTRVRVARSVLYSHVITPNIQTTKRTIHPTQFPS
jgi:hypothetical protein